MGSSISGVLAEVAMQQLELAALTLVSPKLSVRYADDISDVVEKDQLETLHNTINLITAGTKFMLENEVGSNLQFLGVLIERETNGALHTSVYRKETYAERSMHEEVAREFRFSMARSSTRDFGAESALALPPPPSQCIPTKECRIASLAYAPCLPATVRPPGSRASSARFSDRRLSVFDVTLLHRRCSGNRRSRSSTSSQMNAGMPKDNVAGLRSKTGGVTSNSTRPLLPEVSGPERGRTPKASPTASGRCDQNALTEPARSPAPVKSFTSPQMYHPATRTPGRRSDRCAAEEQSGQYSERGPTSADSKLTHFDGQIADPHRSCPADIRMKKFTC
nr:unnamed protein product [Spirometra erinaceieuropaei]